MDKELLEIINHYGLMTQLKYFQTEIFELNEAIIKCELTDYYDEDYERELKDHITEEIADVQVMLNQFKVCYGITNNEIEKIMKEKIKRQLERIENESN